MPLLCAHSMWSLDTRPDYPLISMAQNNLNSLRPSDAIWLQILVIIGSRHGLSVRCQAKQFWWLIQSFPNILDISSSFLNFKWKKPISSMKPSWFSLSGIELVNRNTTEKYLHSAHFYCCFTYSSIFKLFHISSSFFHFRRKKPISFRMPSQFTAK